MTAIIISVVLMIVAVVLDQVTKYAVVANLALGESVDLIPGVLRFTYVQNDGAAFGSLSDARWVFMILSTVFIVAILGYLFWKKPQNKLLLSALILITGGGIGNMVDRIMLGYVIDFIDFCAFPKIWMWVFNVADSFVCVGAGLLALWMILDTVKEYKAEKAKKAAAAEGAVEEEATEEVTEEATEETKGEEDVGK
jgi:signal peptidase II